jgi:hypothetical protein
MSATPHQETVQFVSAPPVRGGAKAAAGDQTALAAFVALCGTDRWRQRMAGIQQAASARSRSGRAAQQRHAVELTIDRLMQPGVRDASAAERRIAGMAAGLTDLHGQLGADGQLRLGRLMGAALDGAQSLVPLFHLIRMIALQRSRGFSVEPVGLNDEAPYDLLLRRAGAEAELACETVSAEDGRDLHRSAWFNLVDGIDPDLQSWLSEHPGRYLLKMTLPHGLREGAAAEPDSLQPLAELQRRIRDMLSRQCRADYDEAAVLRLDPLLLAGAQADELGLMGSLRRQFGPEAQLAVTRSGAGMFVMAARTGRENDIGAAMRRRLAEATPVRLTGARPGILAMFLDDLERSEWRMLRDDPRLESETRQYLTCPDAARLIAVTASSRLELFGIGGPDAAPEGEVRFRNQAHPAARSEALAPAVRSSN